jgi:hypothetical protein
MSPSATRNSRAVKPTTAKKAERNSVPAKGTVSAKKSPVQAQPAKTAAASKAKPVKPEAPKARKISKAETAASELKHPVIMEAEEPKKKTGRIPKAKAAPAMDEPEKLAPEPEIEATPPPVKAGKKTRTAKTAPEAPAEKPQKAARGRKPAAAEPDADDEEMFEEKPSRSRTKMFEETGDEFIEDELTVPDDDVLVPDDIELDPLEIPLELLDPELVDVPRPSLPPKPKPKPKTERRMQVCASCAGQFNWLSVEQLCFNCLKKKLAQRKREDESYGGFAPEAEEEDSGD